MNESHTSDTPLGNIPLGISGFTYRELHQPARLAALLEEFDRALEADDPELFHTYQAYRAERGQGFTATQISDLLVRVAPYVGQFLARLFGIEAERAAAMEATGNAFDTLFCYRREVVQVVEKMFSAQGLSGWDPQVLERDLQLLKQIVLPELIEILDPEQSTSTLATHLLRLEKDCKASELENTPLSTDAKYPLRRLRQAIEDNTAAKSAFADALAEAQPGAFLSHLLGIVYRWSYAAQHHPKLKGSVEGWVSFKRPGRVEFDKLVAHRCQEHSTHQTLAIPETQLRRRDGFALTDRRFDTRQVLYEVDHCIYCHDRDRDSCSKGMRKKDGSWRTNPLGVTLIGCPLEEKISEAHVLKRRGDDIAALALITVDNPMVPGTGHRICNDCMKGCIYQKVEPVNIPQIETNILTSVLSMPYGFEIYSLLTRWNPLNPERSCALPYNGRNILVVGLGPAGYSLAHYLLNEGFGVVGIDALKIEPLPSELTGEGRPAPMPIRDYRALYEELDTRIMAGFGGVAEYGITARWDKNFLKVIYLNLMRRGGFRCYGGIRFGGTLEIEDAWNLGFDHIAVAVGAGEPTIIGMKDNLIRGIRKASDFLMALQLTGAAKHTSLANLQVRLPAGVIGGGLTAIDTATELLAYYPVQVEKILERFEKLVADFGQETVLARFDEEERMTLEEFLVHGRLIRAERVRAQSAGETPCFLPLLEAWGGVTLFYRKALNASPAYRQNHEEVEKALEEGIRIAPRMTPVEAIPDQYGHLRAVKFDHSGAPNGQESYPEQQSTVPLRSLFVAAGTSPNIIYEREHPGTFELDDRFFRRFEPDIPGAPTTLQPVTDTALPKLGKPAPFTSYRQGNRYITFFGDNHPVYAGNVVKAMASAKDGYPYIVRLFEQPLAALEPTEQAARDAALKTFQQRLDEELVAKVEAVHRLTPTIVEVVVKAPLQARQFHPGQFYRVQNLETLAPVIADTSLASEGLALTGAWVDKGKGLVSLIALEMGTSSRLCALWRPGERIVVMGPTGTPTEIPHGQNIALVGGGLGNAVLLSIGQALRAAGNRVLYFAGYRQPADVFKRDALEAASDVVVWAVDAGPGVRPIVPDRGQDRTFVGNIVEAMVAYGSGALGTPSIPLQHIDRMIVIGSARMMAAVKEARSSKLKPYLKTHHLAIGSINSPMQCMMKGVCSQCLCKHVDPKSGEERFVYSCFNQDQWLDAVDFPNLSARLRQNSVQEKLSDLWLDHVLRQYNGRQV